MKFLIYEEKIIKLPECLQEANFSNNELSNLLQTSNKAKEITSVFEGLKGLIKLDLSYNEITVLPEKLFNDCFRLQVFSIVLPIK